MEFNKLPENPLTQFAAVTLRQVTAATVREVCELVVSPARASYVANNAISIAEAHFTPEVWFRAVYADETPVGFAVVSR